MTYRHALWLVGPLLLALAAQLLARTAPLQAAALAPRRCARWVQVGPAAAPLVCLDQRPASRLRRAEVSRACLRQHPPSTLVAGDRLAAPSTGACRRRRMAPGLLVTLGIPVDVNRADAAELATLPAVGPGLARRILAHRRRHGPFCQPADLLGVRGVGRRLLAQIRTRVAPLADHSACRRPHR